MANHTHPPAGLFRAVLDDGQIVEAYGSTAADLGSGTEVPAVLLRMSPARAHALAHVLDQWSRAALVFAVPRSAETTELVLAWTLEAGAAAAGDQEAAACSRIRSGAPSPAQRLAAMTVLRERERGITPVQRVAIVDAAAWWLAAGAGEELAQALLPGQRRHPGPVREQLTAQRCRAAQAQQARQVPVTRARAFLAPLPFGHHVGVDSDALAPAQPRQARDLAGDVLLRPAALLS